MRRILPGTETRPIVCRLLDLQRRRELSPEEHKFLQAAADFAFTHWMAFRAQYPEGHALLDEMYNAKDDPCPLCGRQTAVSIEESTFGYGAAPDTVELKATVKVYTCTHCDEQFTGWEAEEAREAAVFKHLEEKA